MAFGESHMSELEGRRRSQWVGHRAACLIAVACAADALAGLAAHAAVWQPSPGRVQTPIWPGTPPDLAPDPTPETGASTHVSRPTMTVYAPTGRNTGVAVVVFPGGGYQVLAMGLEGTETCDWLTSRGVTCVLLKYALACRSAQGRRDWLLRRRTSRRRGQHPPRRADIQGLARFALPFKDRRPVCAIRSCLDGSSGYALG